MPNSRERGPAATGPAPGRRVHRTYVAYRWARDGWAEPPVETLTPLGTVRARSLPEAKARARAAWPGERAAALRVRRASACRPGVLLEALAADGAAARARRDPGA